MSNDKIRKSKQSRDKIKKQNKGKIKFAENIRRKSPNDEENSTSFLEEFSDRDNDFYVDEIEERKKNKKIKKSRKNKRSVLLQKSLRRRFNAR